MADTATKGKVKSMTKSDLINTLADATLIDRKEVKKVLDALETTITEQVKKRGVIQLPGLVKIFRVKKPATKGGTKPNPFKPGEMMEIKPRPATNVVRCRPLKKLKSAIA